MAQKTKNTRVDDAYDRLKSEILQSKLPPGFQAPEPDIAERLGMSRTPVREALIRLEADGLVDLVPRRGARVLGTSVQDLIEIYELLGALEPLAVAALAQQTIPGDELDKLEAIIRNLEASVFAGDVEAWAIADDDFHRKLLSLNGNRRLERIAGVLHDQIYRGRMVLLRMRSHPIAEAQEYRDLVAAIVSGSDSNAFEQLRKHREKALDALKEIFITCRLPQI